MSIIYIDRKGHKRQGETGQDRCLHLSMDMQ